MAITIEEALRRAEDRAAFLRYAVDAASNSPEVPTKAVLSGLADVCAELERTARAVRKALKVEALDVELPRQKEE